MKILQMRLAPLPVLLGLVLLVPVVVQGQPAPTTQNSRAATIAAEQAEKAKTLHPVHAERRRTQNRVAQTRVPRTAERLLSVLRQRLQRRRLHARGRLPAVLRRSDPRRCEGPLFACRATSCSRSAPIHGVTPTGGSICTRAPAGATPRRWRSTASAATVPRTAANFRMKQALPRRRRRGATRCPGRCSAPGCRTRTSRSRAAPGHAPSIEEVHTPASAPGLGASPTYLHTHRLGRHRLAPVARLCPARRALRSHATTTTPIATAPTASTASMPRSCSTFRILRENWVISLHGLAADDARRRRQRAVLPDAVARQRQHAARLQQLALPRSPQPADVGRVAVDPEPARARHGAFLRHRQGRAAFDDAQLRRACQDDVGIGIRFHSPLATPLRIELARRREGMRLVFAGSAAF